MTPLNIFRIFHQPCFLCLAPSSGAVCDKCLKDLPISLYTCRVCGLPIEVSKQLCGECLTHPKPFDLTLSPIQYRPPVNHLLHIFKDKRPLALIELLAKPLLQSINNTYLNTEQPEAIVPTPSHWKTQVKRAFNPAHLIAEHLAKHTGVEVINALRQPENSFSQKQLNRKMRLANRTATFKLIENKQKLIEGKHLALVDDVITTGATVTALSQILLSHGAKRVDIWALTRTPKPAAL